MQNSRTSLISILLLYKYSSYDYRVTFFMSKCVYIFWATLYIHVHNIYRVSQEEYARLREGVPYVTVYRYNPKHLCPKLNGYGDKGSRKV